MVLGSLAPALGTDRPPRASGKKVIAGVAAPNADDMQLLARLASTGELRPVIDRSYPLENAAQAHAYVDTGRKRGSVVLSVAPSIPSLAWSPARLRESTWSAASA